MAEPKLVIVAGPNGNGKSTLTGIGAFGTLVVIDPDAIARQMEASPSRGLEIAAGREALRKQDELIEAGQSFLVETTLAGRRAFRLIASAKDAGYSVELRYISVDSPDQAVDRVSNRVALGGHNVPEEDVRRRFKGSHDNLPRIVARSDKCVLYDNSTAEFPHREVAVITAELRWTADRCPEWAIRALARANSRFLEGRRPAGRGIGRSA